MPEECNHHSFSNSPDAAIDSSLLCVLQCLSSLSQVGIYDREKTDEWFRGVVTLAGDAASPIPPNLGQGGNKALEDAGVLTHCLLRWVFLQFRMLKLDF